MVNPLDATLEALQNIPDTIDEMNVRKNIISEKQTLQDYDKIIMNLETSDPDMFENIKQQKDSTCFVTPSDNEFCYKTPRGDEDFRVSHLVLMACGCKL